MVIINTGKWAQWHVHPHLESLRMMDQVTKEHIIQLLYSTLTSDKRIPNLMWPCKPYACPISTLRGGTTIYTVRPRHEIPINIKQQMIVLTPECICIPGITYEVNITWYMFATPKINKTQVSILRNAADYVCLCYVNNIGQVHLIQQIKCAAAMSEKNDTYKAWHSVGQTPGVYLPGAQKRVWTWYIQCIPDIMLYIDPAHPRVLRQREANICFGYFPVVDTSKYLVWSQELTARLKATTEKNRNQRDGVLSSCSSLPLSSLCRISNLSSRKYGIGGLFCYYMNFSAVDHFFSPPKHLVLSRVAHNMYENRGGVGVGSRVEIQLVSKSLPR